MVAIPIAFARGTEPRRLPSASEHSALFDGKDLDLVVAKDDAIADRLADQSARDGRDVGDRSRSRIGFVLPDDPERLPPAVVAGERRPSEPNATVSRSTGSGIN